MRRGCPPLLGVWGPVLSDVLTLNASDSDPSESLPKGCAFRNKTHEGERVSRRIGTLPMGSGFRLCGTILIYGPSSLAVPRVCRGGFETRLYEAVLARARVFRRVGKNPHLVDDANRAITRKTATSPPGAFSCAGPP